MGLQVESVEFQQKMEASRNSSSAGTGTGCGICAYASGDSCADTGTTGTGIDSRRTGTGDSGDSGAGVRKEHSADEDGTGSVKTVQVNFFLTWFGLVCLCVERQIV